MDVGCLNSIGKPCIFFTLVLWCQDFIGTNGTQIKHVHPPLILCYTLLQLLINLHARGNNYFTSNEMKVVDMTTLHVVQLFTTPAMLSCADIPG